MDTTAQSSPADQADKEALKRLIDARVAEIRAHMPLTYRAIQDMAGVIGNRAYNLVKRGIAGQPNTFFAVEAGRTVGTPFLELEAAGQLADYIRQFGCKNLVLWEKGTPQAPAQEGNHGTH